MSPSEAARYDLHPYGPDAYPRTHPGHLQAVSSLFGLDPALADQARVLELGCAVGGNLIPVAAQLPASTFVGVELSEVQVQRARQRARALGLDNCRFLLGSFAEVELEGPFDYIVAHGLYSWVSPEVRQELLSLCARLLAPHGVAYMSFNAFPGWRMRLALRDLLVRHVSHLPLEAQLPRARELLEFLAQDQQGQDTPWARQLQLSARMHDLTLVHDFLSPWCEPFYLRDFAAHLAPHGLRYLCEAEPSEHWMAGHPPEAWDFVARWGGDRLGREEALDFLRGNPFRRALVCRAEHAEVEPTPPDLSRFWLSADLSRDPGQEGLYQGREVSLRTQHPRTRAVLDALVDEQWLHFDQLLERAEAQAGPGSQQDREQLILDLWSWFTAGELRPHLHPRPWGLEVPERPRVPAWIRDGMERGPALRPTLHEVPLEPLSRHLVLLADGTRDRVGLVKGLLELARTGELVVEDQGEPVRDARVLARAFARALEPTLRELARRGLLEARD